MPKGNQSFVTEFVILGFPGLQPKFYSLVSVILFIVYFCTLIGNVVVIILFATHNALHKPMYFIYLNLVVSDLIFSTTTLPRIIAKYWFQAGVVSFFSCFLQMYLVHYCGTVTSFILLVMSLDRYVAICYPLRYQMVITHSTVHILNFTVWALVHPLCLSIVIRAYPLPYCASNTVVHCYCDHISVSTLACTDWAIYIFPIFVLTMVVLLVPLAFIVFSYCSIIVAVLKIASTQGRIKTLSTCSGQLIIIALYFVPRCLVYLFSGIGLTFNSDIRIVIIMIYSLLPPMINPIIYSLRTEEIKQILIKRIRQTQVHNQILLNQM